MTHCPRCGSARIGSNAIHVPLAKVDMNIGVRATRITEHPLIVFLREAANVTVAVANRLRPQWRCDHCDHRFS